MDSAVENVELLVHITAPTTAAGDDRYRELARAHVDFVSSRVTRLTDAEDSSWIDPSSDAVEDSFVEVGPSKHDSFIQTPPVESTPPAGKSIHLGARAVLDYHHDGLGVGEDSNSSIAPSSQQGGHDDDGSLIEEVPDSYPPDSMWLDPFMSPTRILEHHLRRIKSGTWPPKRPLEAGAALADGLASDEGTMSQKVAKTRSQQAPRSPTSPLRNHESDMPASSAGITASPASTTSCNSSADGPSMNPSGPLADVGTLSPVEPSEAESTDTTSALLRGTSPRCRRSDQTPPPAADPVTPVPTRGMPNPSGTTAIPPEVLLARRKEKYAALDIFPPEPPVSVDHLDEASLLTPHLRKLAEQAPLEQRYRQRSHSPAAMGTTGETAALRPLERGYWLLDMSSWDEPSRWAVWACLHGCIRDGAAGWGVWCLRDEPCVRIRTYCWASVAGHVYLLLDDASGGRLKDVDVDWVGGDGRVRISVPAAEG